MASEAVKLERIKLKAKKAEWSHQREQFLMDRVLSPGVVRVALMAAIIAYATHEARSPTNIGPVRSALSFALPGVGIPMLAAESGIKDKYALAAISAASIGYTTGQMLLGWKDAGVFPQLPSAGDFIESVLPW